MVSGAVIALSDPPVTGKATITVSVSDPSGGQRSTPFEATVDTGFTGFLTLTPGAIAQLGLPFATNQPAVLADGAIGHYDVHVGRISWHGQQRLVPVYKMNGDPLVGMALLWNSRLTMNVVPDGAVTIVPMLS